MADWVIQSPLGAAFASQKDFSFGVYENSGEFVFELDDALVKFVAYVLQGSHSSLFYANNGELVYALDGSLLQFGSLWANQLVTNSAWIG